MRNILTSNISLLLFIIDFRLSIQSKTPGIIETETALKEQLDIQYCKLYAIFEVLVFITRS